MRKERGRFDPFFTGASPGSGDKSFFLALIFHLSRKLPDPSHMLEFLFMLYLASGSLKGILHAYGFEPPIDITLLTGVVGVSYALFKGASRNFAERLSRVSKERTALLLGSFLLWMLASTLWITPSEEFVYWKGFAFLTNIVAFLIPLLNRSFRIEFFLKWFLGYALLYGLFNFFTYACVRLDMVPAIGLEGEGLLERLYLKGGLILGTAGILTFYLKKPWGFLLLNLSLYLLVATGARGPILFFCVTLLAYLIHAILRYTRTYGLRLHSGARSSYLKWGLALLLGNIVLIGTIGSSQLLSAPYERTLYRYEVLMQGFSDQEKEGPPQNSEGASDKKQTAGESKSKSSERSDPPNMQRLEEFAYVLDKVTERPSSFLWGYGFGSYNLILHGEEGREYPHNVLLEIWFELGSIGLVLAIGFVASCILRMIRQKNFVILFAVLFYFMNTMKSLSMVDIRLAFGLLALGTFISASHGMLGAENIEREERIGK